MSTSSRLPLLAAGLLVAACTGGSGGAGGAASHPVAPDVAPVAPPEIAQPGTAQRRTLDADEIITSASGATFTASAGWMVEEQPDRITLTSPEGDVTLAHIEVNAADRDTAIRAAWASWRPDFALEVAHAMDLPPRDGWDALGQVFYVTPAEQLRLVAAVARRKGDTWYVSLVDGVQAGFERRGAQLLTALESVQVPGLDKESFAGRAAHPLDAARLAELDAFIEEARAAIQIPGAAIAIVQGGKVVHEKGFGVRQLGKPARVGPGTLFMVGSVTKALTTLMIARLVDDGRLGWDTPTIEVLPSFGLGDEETTRAVTMRHTACACTGMPRQDLEFLFEGKATPEERLASMKTMKPTTRLGETFQYSNLMVSAGGFAAGRAWAPRQALGPAYDAAMKSLVFAPLGMRSTSLDFKAVARADHAVPHPTDLRGHPAPVPVSAEAWVLPVRPAGGVWSSASDMARVLLLELGRGTLDGKQIVSEAQMLARREPQVKITDEQSYGLGLVISRQLGVTTITHGGNTGGFTAYVMFLPEHDVGMVLLANAGGVNLFTGAVQRRLLELLFDGRPEAHENLSAMLARQQQLRAEEWALIQPEPDAAFFRELSGAWTAPGLGRIELRTDRGAAVLDAGEWKVPVGKKTGRDGTVSLISIGGIIAGLELVPREQDGRAVLVLDAGQHSYVFERAPAK